MAPLLLFCCISAAASWKSSLITSHTSRPKWKSTQACYHSSSKLSGTEKTKGNQMAKTINQDIPSEMADAYDTSLHRAAIWIPGSSIRMVRKRVPFYMGHMQNSSTQSPSGAQRLVRAAFKKSCNCFNIQPYSGGATPPAGGPRNRSWWYSAAAGSGLWYYDYFIQQTWPFFYSQQIPTWCIKGSYSPTGNMVQEQNPTRVSYGYTGCYAINYPAPGGLLQYYGKRNGYVLFDLTPANLATIIPGYESGPVNSAVLHFTVHNANLRNLENDQFFNQTGNVHFAPSSYWNPTTLTWNNAPSVSGGILSRSSPAPYEYYGNWYNDGLTEHYISVTTQVNAAIASATPYCSLFFEIEPPAPEADLYNDPDWNVGGTQAGREYELLFL